MGFLPVVYIAGDAENLEAEGGSAMSYGYLYTTHSHILLVTFRICQKCLEIVRNENSDMIRNPCEVGIITLTNKNYSILD